MDELFSRILTLLPIAVLVFLRLFYDTTKRKKKAAQAAQAGQAPAGTGKAAPPKKESLFSSLMKMLDGNDYQPAADSLQNKVLLHYEEEAARPTRPPARPAVHEAKPVPSLFREESAPVVRPAANKAVAPALQTARPSQARLGQARLRQAVVMAEILGQPRGLKPYGEN